MIELYHSENCPYCRKVRLFLEEKGISYISKPVDLYNSTPIGEALKKTGGKLQVPFLLDKERGVQMYESDDIITYISRNYIARYHSE